MARWKGALAGAVTLAALIGPVSSSGAATDRVVVASGSPVQIAVVLDRSDSIGATYSAGIRNAIRMAVQFQRSIRGFPIELNNSFDAPCTGDAAFNENAATARAVVANKQNVAVLGHICSAAFGGTGPGACPSPSSPSALSIYEQSALVTINGSTTNACLPAIGPTTFDATAVPDPGFDTWYAEVTALPSDRLWQFVYRIEFGVAPTPLADLYFDATRLLLSRLEQTANVVDGSLVIDRATLAQAVRHTSNFPGVSCGITLDPATGFRVGDEAALARCASPFAPWQGTLG